MDASTKSIPITLKELYKRKGYLDKYGGSLFITLMVLLLFFLFLSYFRVMREIVPLKANWNSVRCNPYVIPFAGLINKDPNMSSFEYTGKNFSGCVNTILLNITNDFLKPLYYVMSLLHTMSSDLTSSVQTIRTKISSVVSKVEKIDSEIMSRIFNMLVPLRYIFVKLNDTFHKIQGTIVTSIYSVLSGYMAMKSFLGAFIDIMIGVLFAIIAIVVPLLLFFFTAPLAIPGLIAFGVVAGFVTTIIIGLSDILDMTERSVPPKPSMSRCFDENTVLKLKDGRLQSIRDIQINDVLEDGSYITAKFVLSSENVDMYMYKNIIVSGTHIAVVGHRHICVKDIPGALRIRDYRKPLIYCINTSNKYIRIGENTFTDWDELDEENMYCIRKNAGKYLPTYFNRHYVHSILEGGFCGDTFIDLSDGTSKRLSCVRVGDILKGGIRVLGVVHISTQDITVKKYYIHDYCKTKRHTTITLLDESDEERDGSRDIWVEENGVENRVQDIYTVPETETETETETYTYSYTYTTNPTCYILGGPNNQICDEDLGCFSTMDVQTYEELKQCDTPTEIYHLLTDNGKMYLNGVMFYDYNGCIDVFLD